MRTCAKCGLTYDDEFDLCGVDGFVLTHEFAGAPVLDGRYRLDQRLDSGAMGVVYRATHLEVGSTVAVKTMSQRLDGKEVALARFRREARVLGQIKHPNAVLVMDFGIESRDSRSIAYLVTEYLRGESLERRLRERGAIPIPEAERIVTPLCEALEEAHRVGVVHRDLKPSNVFLEQLHDGTEIVKVLDFGIAKLIDADEAPKPIAAKIPNFDTLPDPQPIGALDTTLADGSDTLTGAGDIVGTIPYMAPEQFENGSISAATDVYALATLIYRLLSGRLPFDGPAVQIIAQKTRGIRPRLADAGIEVPRDLDTLLLQCFALSPGDRPSSVLDVSRALRAAVNSAERSGRTEDLRLPERILAISDQFRALRALLESGRSAAEPLQSYETIRDRILSLDSAASRLRLTAGLLEHPIEAREAKRIEEALSQLEPASAGIGKSLRTFCGVAGIADDHVEYLDTLCQRLSKVSSELIRNLRSAVTESKEAARSRPVEPIGLFDDPESDRTDRLQALAVSLGAKDALIASEALDELLTQQIEAIVAHLGRVRPGDALGEALLEGLWHHADALLMRDLYPEAAGVFRLTPFLAKLTSLDTAQPFALLAKVFRRNQSDETKELARIVREIEPAIDSVQTMTWRCLVASPVGAVAREALRRTRPSELWAVVSHSRTPLSLHKKIFETVRFQVAAEYRKIFFICIRDSMLACAAAATSENRRELDDAVALLTMFFSDSCFHEDVVFEPLLQLDSAVRRAYQSLGLQPPDGESYDQVLAKFREKGPAEEMPLENMLEVPLPIQRKLARTGHFLTYFVAHTNERIAMETVPHLLKREDITPFFKIVKIHRSVLVELVKEERLFRREEPRLALLNNPKTPAYLARRYIPSISKAYLKQLARSRHISAEVRQLATGYLKRFDH
jgi:serine/threonine protein kinase